MYPMFIAALFTVGKIWKQFKYLLDWPSHHLLVPVQLTNQVELGNVNASWLAGPQCDDVCSALAFITTVMASLTFLDRKDGGFILFF